MSTESNIKRPLDDTSYEPNRLYRAFGKPNLNTWLLYVGAALGLSSLAAAALGLLVT